MPPPEAVQDLRRRAKDRYSTEEDVDGLSNLIVMPKERLHMAKMYRNQIIKGIKREKDKERLNQDLHIVQSDQNMHKEGPLLNSPISVTPQKHVDEIKRFE